MRLPLSTLEVFNAIAREGSMRAAAQALGIKRSTVSHQLKTLEQELGTALFVRTTRSINLTEAGRALLRASGPAFEQLADGLESARTSGHGARGCLKLAVPEFAYQLLLSEALASFQARYPEIEVELSLNDALTDILQEGMHAGMRLGGVISEDMIAINLTAPLTCSVVASPGYLDLHGRPGQPTDLLTHSCISYRFQSSGQLAPWIFAGPDGNYPVETKASLISNSVPVIINAALQGQGIVYTFRECCTDALATGLLEEVLNEHQVTMPGINIYFPREYREFVPLRLFIQHLKQEVKEESAG